MPNQLTVDPKFFIRNVLLSLVFKLLFRTTSLEKISTSVTYTAMSKAFLPSIVVFGLDEHQLLQRVVQLEDRYSCSSSIPVDVLRAQTRIKDCGGPGPGRL